MNIIVCIKQVPDTTQVDIDEKTGVLKREGIDTKLNPYDLFAIETAMKLKEEHGGTIKAITMGPIQAKEVLKEAFAMGVDEGAILSDKAFAGADVLATSYAISGGIMKLGQFDLIICGKQTTDGDTAQVGPEIAEYLDIPHVANVTEIINIDDNAIQVEMDMSDSVQIQEIQFPCLITVDKNIFVPRLPSYKKRLSSAQREISVFTMQDLEDKNPLHYGLNGSPTQVERVFPPQSTTEKISVEGSGEELAEFLFQKLKELKFV
jgi:electron transfer flavoprotein beta subunit